MRRQPTDQQQVPRPARRFAAWGLLCACLLTGPGCAAMNPVRGTPAALMPYEYRGPSRGHRRTIDLSLLVQTPPDQHRVAAGDVLSIYVPRVLGSQPTDVVTVGLEPPINLPLAVEDAPTVGYPIQVRDDDTISLPQIPPLEVGGLTLFEVEERIRQAYTVEHRILRPAEAMVLVSLQRPRMHRVLVVRQETSDELTSGAGPGTVNIGFSKRGTARVVMLKAYENDVLHALAYAEGADGLPGLDAENTIYIIRRRSKGSLREPQGEPRFPAPELLGHAASAGHVPSVVPSVVQAGHQAPKEKPVQTADYAPHPTPFNNYRSAQGGMAAAHSMSGTPDPGGRPESNGHRGAAAPRTSLSGPPIEPGHSGSSPVETASHAYGGGLPAPAPHAGNPGDWPRPVQMTGPEFYPMPMEGLPPQPGAYPLQSIPRGEMVYGAPEHWGTLLGGGDPTIDNPNVIKIPVRLARGEMPYFTEEQITLYDGDIVFIESRETEVFYTGGLLGGGQFTLPRDYDLRVLEAISIAEGRTAGAGALTRSIGGVSALNQDITTSASRLVILRTLPNGHRVPIEVDLHRAMRYQEENILVQAGDLLLLQYTFPESICAFTQRFLMEGALIGLAAGSFARGQ